MPSPASAFALEAPASPERPSGGRASQERALQDAPAPYSRPIGAKVDRDECYREVTPSERVVADAEARILPECDRFWVYLACQCTAKRVLRGCNKADCTRPGCRKAVAAKRAKVAHARLIASCLEAAPGWRPAAVTITRLVFTAPEWARDLLAVPRQANRAGAALAKLLKRQLGAAGLMLVAHPVGGDAGQVRDLHFHPHFEVYLWRARGGRGVLPQLALEQLEEGWREVLGCHGDEAESMQPWAEFYRAGGPCQKGKGRKCYCPGCLRGALAYSLRTFPGWSSWRGNRWVRWYGKRAKIEDKGPDPCPHCGGAFRRLKNIDNWDWRRSVECVTRQAQQERGPPAQGVLFDTAGDIIEEWYDLATFDRGLAREFSLSGEA